MLRPRHEAPVIMRGLRIASLGLLNNGQVLENEKIIKSFQNITRRLSIFRKLCYSKKGLTRPNKNGKTILYIFIILYVFLIYEETSFVCLRKFCRLWAVSAKYVRLHILENEVESSQNALHYIQNSFFFPVF